MPQTDAPIGTAGESAWNKLRRRKVVQWGIVSLPMLVTSVDGKIKSIERAD